MAEALSESTRREIGKWIAGVKGADAQARRAGQMAERLLLAIEGKERTSPVLEAAFVRHPGARRGRKATTAAQRRGHLMGIFSYRSPEGGAAGGEGGRGGDADRGRQDRSHDRCKDVRPGRGRGAGIAT